ncbi:MAG: hypothetical protein ASARMPREDX12_001673 [Alectoria sarmentosa]|nr:MAG: hypothetical protein ASARMPREDX12_001673 [Alectoria sarmentosa]
MASKKIPLQGNSKGSSSAPSAAVTSPAVGVDVCYRIVWEKGPGGEDAGWGCGPPSPEFQNFVDIEGKSTDKSTTVNCIATLHWRDANELKFFCVYDTKTGTFSGFEWTNKDLFGDGADNSNAYIEHVSISMKGKSYNETEEAAEKEVLDEAETPFLFVVILFTAESEKGLSYGKKVVGGAFEHCVLSTEEKKRLRLD